MMMLMMMMMMLAAVATVQTLSVQRQLQRQSYLAAELSVCILVHRQ